MKKENVINLTGYSKISKETGKVILVLINKDLAVHAEVNKDDLKKKDFCNVVINSLIKSIDKNI